MNNTLRKTPIKQKQIEIFKSLNTLLKIVTSYIVYSHPICCQGNLATLPKSAQNTLIVFSKIDCCGIFFFCVKTPNLIYSRVYFCTFPLDMWLPDWRVMNDAYNFSCSSVYLMTLLRSWLTAFWSPHICFFHPSSSNVTLIIYTLVFVSNVFLLS